MVEQAFSTQGASCSDSNDAFDAFSSTPASSSSSQAVAPSSSPLVPDPDLVSARPSASWLSLSRRRFLLDENSDTMLPARAASIRKASEKCKSGATGCSTAPPRGSISFTDYSGLILTCLMSLMCYRDAIVGSAARLISIWVILAPKKVCRENWRRIRPAKRGYQALSTRQCSNDAAKEVRATLPTRDVVFSAAGREWDDPTEPANIYLYGLRHRVYDCTATSQLVAQPRIPSQHQSRATISVREYVHNQVSTTL